MVGPHNAPGRTAALAAAELNMRTLRWAEVAVTKAPCIGGSSSSGGSVPHVEGGSLVAAAGPVRVVAFHGALMVYGVAGDGRGGEMAGVL